MSLCVGARISLNGPKLVKKKAGTVGFRIPQRSTLSSIQMLPEVSMIGRISLVDETDSSLYASLVENWKPGLSK